MLVELKDITGEKDEKMLSQVFEKSQISFYLNWFKDENAPNIVLIFKDNGKYLDIFFSCMNDIKIFLNIKIKYFRQIQHDLDLRQILNTWMI